MRLLQIKSELIAYARTLIPFRYRNYLRVTGSEGDNYMRLQTAETGEAETGEIKALLKKNFGQEKFVTHISKNYDIKGLATIESFEFDKSENNKRFENLEIIPNINNKQAKNIFKF